MGRRYCRLSGKERSAIYRWHATGKSARWIGAALGRHASTITRELERNSQPTKQWPGGYDPVRADGLARRRRRRLGRFKLACQPELCRLVRDKLAMGWSPETIAARLALDHGSTVISHEAIYRYAYHRSAQKDHWHRLLPWRKHRRGRPGQRGGSPLRFIRDRVSIAERPALANLRREPGHWEADLMAFSRTGQNLLVVQERISRFILLASPPSRQAVIIAARLIRWFKALPDHLCRSITHDNGPEFAHHYKVKALLALKTYFCDPHSPWQKGGIENMNGRLRRDLPRRTNLGELSSRAICAIASRHNNRPRKCLGFKTPQEVFDELLSTVALQT